MALALSRDSKEGTARQGGGAATGWTHSTARRRQEEAQGGAPRGLRCCPTAPFTARRRASQPAALCSGQRGAGPVLLQPTCLWPQWEAHSGTLHPRPQRAPARSSSFLCDFESPSWEKAILARRRLLEPESHRVALAKMGSSRPGLSLSLLSLPATRQGFYPKCLAPVQGRAALFCSRD